MNFTSFGLIEPLLRAVNESNYTNPTPIQCQGIPPVLSGKDVIAIAQTGTGKTASFALPLLQRVSAGREVPNNRARVLVLAPTRELAIQVADKFSHYGKYLPVKTAVVYGGVKINPQMMKLRGGLDFLVATPGRLLDLYRQNAIKFDQLETLVLDEADRMLDLGFSDEMNQLFALLPQPRQTLLYSATFSSALRTLATALLHHPVQIEVSPLNATATKVNQWLYEVDKGKKSALLSYLIRNGGWQQALIFTRTKKGADRLALSLEKDGISAAVIHGDKSQNARSRALSQFKLKRVRVMVATDVAARGIDICCLPYVVNFDLPKVAEDYIHRIGRTGRAGCEGQGVSLVSADEVDLLSAIESLIGTTLRREIEPEFTPMVRVPASVLRALRAKKPKKVKQKSDTEPVGGNSLQQRVLTPSSCDKWAGAKVVKGGKGTKKNNKAETGARRDQRSVVGKGKNTLVKKSTTDTPKGRRR